MFLCDENLEHGKNQSVKTAGKIIGTCRFSCTPPGSEHGNKTIVKFRRILLWEDYSIKTLCRGTLSTRFGHRFLIHFFEGYAFVIVIELQELHFMITFRTIQRGIPKERRIAVRHCVKLRYILCFSFEITR